MDLPRESAFWASSAAWCFQTALRLLRFDLEVRFLGTAIVVVKVSFNSLAILTLESQDAIDKKMILPFRVGVCPMICPLLP